MWTLANFTDAAWRLIGLIGLMWCLLMGPLFSQGADARLRLDMLRLSYLEMYQNGNPFRRR